MKTPQVKVRVVHEYFLFREEQNPFIKLKTDSGIILAPGLNESRETGEMETLDKIIGFGIVTEVGDKCTYVKPGDGVFYDRRSIRAIPVGEDTPIWQYQERNIVGYVDGSDGHMQEAFTKFYAEQAELEASRQLYNEQVEKEKEARLAKVLLERGTKEFKPSLLIKNTYN